MTLNLSSDLINDKIIAGDIVILLLFNWKGVGEKCCVVQHLSMCPGFEFRRKWHYTSVEFVVGSRLCSERFLYLRVPVLKTQQFQIVGWGKDEERWKNEWVKCFTQNLTVLGSKNHVRFRVKKAKQRFSSINCLTWLIQYWLGQFRVLSVARAFCKSSSNHCLSPSWLEREGNDPEMCPKN